MNNSTLIEEELAIMAKTGRAKRELHRIEKATAGVVAEQRSKMTRLRDGWRQHCHRTAAENEAAQAAALALLTEKRCKKCGLPFRKGQSYCRDCV